MKSALVDSQPKRSLVTTLAFAFVGSSMLFLLSASGLQLYSNIRAREAALLNHQQRVAQEASRTVSGFIEKKFSVLETVTWVADPCSMTQVRQRQMLQGLLGLERSFRQLILLDKHSQTLAHASRFSLETSTRLSEQLKNAALTIQSRTRRAVSAVYIDPASSEPMVILSVPVTDVLEGFIGSLIAELNLKFMWEMVERLDVGKGGLAYVVNRFGDLIAFGDTARVLKGENVAHLSPVAEFMRSPVSFSPDRVSRYRGILGTSVVGAYVPLKEPDWAVVTELPWKEAYREVIEESLISLAITLIMVVLAGLVGVSLARRLSVPLIQLTRTATRIAGGERDLQAPVQGSREVADLAAAFNSMTAQLEQSLSELERQVAEVRRAENAVKVSEERLRLALEGTTDGIWDWNLQTNEIYFSPRYFTMVGYEPGEFPGVYESWRSRVHPEDLQAIEKTVQTAISENSPFSIEFRFKAKNGEWTWILGRGKVVELGEAGQAVRVAGSHCDISGRKEAEQALIASQSVLRATMESIRDGLLVVGKNGIISHYNSRFLEMWSIPEAIVAAKCDSDLIDYVTPQLRDPEQFAARIIQLYQSPAMAEDLLHLKDGRIFERFCYPLIRNDLEEGRVWLFRDITDRKQREEELQQRTDELTRFIYTVSHDMKTPLVTIRAFTGFLRKDIEKNDVERIAKDLDFIGNAADKLSRLLDELLDLSRIGRKVNPPQDVVLQDLVDDALKLVAGPILQRNVSVHVTQEPVVVRGDRPRLVEVFQNLLDNAVKFMGDQPEPAIWVGVEQEGAELVFHVRDNGMGIDPRFRHKVFDLFEKLEPGAEGTGIGLALVKRIVEVHGGRIWAESPGLGGGTTFYFTLPQSRRLS